LAFRILVNRSATGSFKFEENFVAVFVTMMLW
jgi:hypothetical protein